MSIDPVTRYAEDLAAAAESLHALVTGPAFAVMRPHLEALAAVLSEPTRPLPDAPVAPCTAPPFPGER